MAKITVEGNELVIRYSLDNAGRLSGAGKSKVIDGVGAKYVSIQTPFGVAQVGGSVFVWLDNEWTGGMKLPAQPTPTLIKTNGGAAAH